MWYNFVDSEIEFFEDYQRSFKNEYQFFVHFYPIWAEIAPADEETGCVEV